MMNQEASVLGGNVSSLVGGSRRTEALVHDLESAIVSGRLRPGARLAPIRTLADDYGVSFVTARSAVGQLEKAGLVRSVHGSGVYVQERKDTVGVKTVYLLMDNRGHVFSHIAAHLADRLQGTPYRCVLGPSVDNYSTLDDFAGLFAEWCREPPHAIVLQWDVPGLDEKIASICGDHTRVILIWRPILPAMNGWMRVDFDAYAAFRLSAEYLLARGHRRIALLTHPRLLDADHPHNRHKAWVGHTEHIEALGHAMRELTGSRGGAQIVYLKAPPPRPFEVAKHDIEIVADLAERFQRPDRPSALVGLDGYIRHVLRAAQCAGLRVPEDLAVVGIGNTPWSEACGFPSVCVREDLIAKSMADLIGAPDERIQGVSSDIRITPTLVLRSAL